VVGRSVVASTGGVVFEAGPVPPPVLVPNFPNNAPGLVPVAANFPNNAPLPAGAPGVGVPVAAIVSVPASAVFQSGHANPPPEGHHVFQIPYFDLCYSSGDEERNASNAPVVRNIKIKVEPGTQQLATEGSPLSQGQGESQGQGDSNHLLGLSKSQHNQPAVGAFPYSQQDPFSQNEEKDNDDEEEEEVAIRNQQVFRIGEGIILDGIYCPNIKCLKDNFCLEELVFLQCCQSCG